MNLTAEEIRQQAEAFAAEHPWFAPNDQQHRIDALADLLADVARDGYQCGLDSQRARFAGMAMQGYIANPNLFGPEEALIERSVRSADALLAALKEAR